MEKNKIELKDAKCTKLSISAPVQFASEPEKKGSFLINAYTGATVDRWWGNLTIDLAGIKSSQRMPVFLNHNQSQVVGWTKKAWTDDKAFQVSGQFATSTDAAQEASGLADEGFPWQASIGVSPLKIISIESGATHNINGRIIKGPSEIWIESEVYETSFVPLGADDNTSVDTFSKFEEQAPPGDTDNPKKKGNSMDFTLENLTTEAPKLLAQIQGAAVAGQKQETEAATLDAATNERERIQAVFGQSLPGHDELIQKLAFDGKTSGPEAAVQILAAERGRMATASQNLASDAIPPVPVALPKDPLPASDAPLDEVAFNADKELKAEFGDFTIYDAYNKAMDAGLARVISGKEK